MRVPDREYSLKEFHRYLVDQSDEVFADDKRKRWLKIYCLLVSDQGWQDRLFAANEITRLGEVLKIEPSTTPIGSDDSDSDLENSNPEPERYYIAEYCPGLLLMYTTANNDEYQKDLGRRIDRCRGVTQMWMKPDLFETLWKGILERSGGYAYFFTASRSSFDAVRCKIRPECKRRLNYTGRDAIQTMQEMQESYGVLPEIVYLQADQDLKLHIRNDGLFAAREISANALNLFFTHLDEIKEDILRMWKTSNQFNFELVREAAGLQLASVNAGRIKLNAKELDSVAFSRMKDNLEGFSIIDAHLETGSFSLTATVIDERKNSVFDISATESQILIVPKFRTTQESFIRFYKEIVETIDESAELSLANPLA